MNYIYNLQNCQFIILRFSDIIMSMKKNEEYIVQCIDDTDLVSGVVKIENIVVFVPNLMIGEKAKIKIVKVKKNYAYGIILELIEKNPNRVVPICPIFKSCGGCSLQYMDYEYQLEYKHRHLIQLFDNTIEIKKILGMNDPWFYRNKAQFPIQIKDNKIVSGFYRQHSNDIVPCGKCYIQDKEINKIYTFLLQNLTLNEAKGLRHIFIRHSNLDEVQVVFIGKLYTNLNTITQKLLQNFENIKSIVFNLNTRNDNVILGENYKVLFGSDSILENCIGNKINLHFKSFFQVNPRQMEVLYKEAIKAAQLCGNETCIDMYAGTGTIGISIAKYVKKVIGVEIVKEAVENAKYNVKMNGLQNCEYICQDASQFVHEFKEKNIDVVFIDPPRKGMSEAGIIDTIHMNPKKIIYISCNPKTLARDLKIFKEYHYHCEYIQPVDMFCQTNGLECVAKLTKIG